MILISHKGNLDGRVIEFENRPDYINHTLSQGYNVEVDVWFKNNEFYLGHDTPMYKVGTEYLKNNKIWCHAKNIDALYPLQCNDIHYFWHQEDDLTITSKGQLWVKPGKQPVRGSIAVLPELYNEDTSQCIGICSDKIKEYK